MSLLSIRARAGRLTGSARSVGEVAAFADSIGAHPLGIGTWKGSAGLTTDARTEVERFLLGDRFACLAGRSAWRQGGITHRHYEVMGGDEAARLMAADLAEFVGGADWRSRKFTSFIATFEQPRGVDEPRFEELLWEHLQLLHEADAERFGWAEGCSSDPQSSEFKYSVAGIRSS